MKVATWNVNGIRARHEQFIEWVAGQQPDVICLQEIKASPAQVPETLLKLEGYWSYWHGAGGYSGVALHISRRASPAEPSFTHPAFDTETRVVQAQIGDTVYASVYVPNGGKDYDAKIAFLHELEGYAAATRQSGQNLVVCGDINIARADMDVHPKERKANAVGQRPDERDLLERILGHDLVDIGRKLHPDDENFFTWWAPWRNLRQRNIGWRIDYILASSALAGRVVACESYREIGTSDHAPLVATFE
ncbi:MAG TPA: exodeoxyribonuclease III [Thermoanaerobaculia bacterium]|nr:exodeoxyribonuclease III [Thermoanaerobaculia bacterium]